MSDREKLRKIYDVLEGIRYYNYEDLTKHKLFKVKEEIYEILIGRNKDDRETIFIGNGSKYRETIF